MLSKLIPVDDIPLRLGSRLPRAEEKAKNIAEMERIAKMWDDNDARSDAVRWVPSNNPAGVEPGALDPTIQASDARHPAFRKAQRWHHLSVQLNAGAIRVYCEPTEPWPGDFTNEMWFRADSVRALERAIERNAPKIERLRPHCSDCGVAHGEKHYLHCGNGS